MSRLPEAGDALKSVTVMSARLNLVALADDDGCIDVGTIHVDGTTGDAEGEGMASYYRCYSDLFSLGETVVTALPTVDAFQAALDRGEDPRSVLLSLYMQAKGTGTLEERQRWEKR